jgi:hypothetical protein
LRWMYSGITNVEDGKLSDTVHKGSFDNHIKLMVKLQLLPSLIKLTELALKELGILLD